MKKQNAEKGEKSLKGVRLFYDFDISKLEFAEGGAPEEIQVLPVGEWNHPFYGPMKIDASDITEFKKNFDAKVRRDIPITEGHDSFEESEAVGWFKELFDRGTQGLYATVEWTPKGKTLLAEKSFKYFSPEFYTEYEDPETRNIYKDVLVGGALTNKPYFKNMKAVVASEFNIYSFNEMNIEEILAKKPGELNAEERKVLRENKESLNEEQLAAFGADLEEEAPEEETKEVEKKEGEEEETKKEGEKDADPVEASEMVQVRASELAALKAAANDGQAGRKALAKLRDAEIKTTCEKLVLSETNKAGKFLAKSKEKLASFVAGLTESQRNSFSELVKDIPDQKMFGEVGDGGASIGKASEEVEKKIQKKLSENKGMGYKDAALQVFAEDKGLEKRFNEEMTAKSN